MGIDRHLIDTIKTHFANTSSAQLQELLRAKDPNRWSAEAIAAAGEVLQDRALGRAVEPPDVEEEPPASSTSDWDDDIRILCLGLNLIGAPFGLDIFPVYERSSCADNADDAGDAVVGDTPVPFGPKTAWLALRTSDTAGVARALGLQKLRTATWAEGIGAAYQEASVFVTPPLGDWTVAVGMALLPPEQVASFVKPLLELLSRRFGNAQYFCTHRDVELHLWAAARKGQLIRGYGWLGQERRILWDEGEPTKHERYLGVPLRDGGTTLIGEDGDEGPTAPDESYVMQLACLWSINPTTLDNEFKEPVMGLLGDADWRACQANRWS